MGDGFDNDGGDRPRVIDLAATYVARMDPGDDGTEPPVAPSRAPTLTAAPLAPAAKGAALETPLRTLTDAFTLWGKAIHDGVEQHISPLMRRIDETAQVAENAERAAAVAQLAVRNVPQRLEAAEATVVEAAGKAHTARGEVAGILNDRLPALQDNLERQRGDLGRLDGLFADLADRIERREVEAHAQSVELARQRAATAALAAKLRHRTVAGVVAVLALTAAAMWLAWPHIAKLAGIAAGQ
jgi:hypothetical protein